MVCRCTGKDGEPLWIRFRDSIFKREEDGSPWLSLSLGAIVDAPSDGLVGVPVTAPASRAAGLAN